MSESTPAPTTAETAPAPRKTRLNNHQAEQNCQNDFDCAIMFSHRLCFSSVF